MLNRRGFLVGLAAALAAPAIVKSGVLMPVKLPLILRPRLDVACPEDFGAIGDGVADDTLAVLRAMNAGLCVLGGGGRYLITETLNWPEGLERMERMSIIGDRTLFGAALHVPDFGKGEQKHLRDIHIDARPAPAMTFVAEGYVHSPTARRKMPLPIASR